MHSYRSTQIERFRSFSCYSIGCWMYLLFFFFLLFILNLFLFSFFEQKSNRKMRTINIFAFKNDSMTSSNQIIQSIFMSRVISETNLQPKFIDLYLSQSAFIASIKILKPSFQLNSLIKMMLVSYPILKYTIPEQQIRMPLKCFHKLLKDR